MIRRKPLYVFTVALALLVLLAKASAQSVPPNLDLSDLPALTIEGDNLLIAIKLENHGQTPAEEVVLTSVTLRSFPRVKPLNLPFPVGDVEPNEDAVLQLAFAAADMREGLPYLLSVEGTYLYRANGSRQRFQANLIIRRPLPDEGEDVSSAVDVFPQFVDGANFPPDPRGFSPDEANEEEEDFPVPEGKLIGNLQPDNVELRDIRQLGGGIPLTTDSDKIISQAVNDPVTFFRVGTSNVQNNINNLFPWDPSGADVDVPNIRGGSTPLVFLTGNTYALMSTDGGANFTRLDPTTIFPNNVDGGLCCDQVIQYVPSIDRILWFMQFSRGAGTNSNRIRLASASPQQVINSNGTSWTYWDMTSATFNLGNNWMDYPDLAFTNNFLHISTDRVNQGLFVIRAPLNEIRDSLTIHLRYTDPANGSVPYGSHLTQDLSDRAYWFGHNSTSSLRIFRWMDNSTSYSWRSIDVNSWNNSNYATNAPNSVDWLSFGFGRAAVRGATHSRNVSLFEESFPVVRIAWSAGRAGGFAQPYVRMLEIADVTVPIIGRVLLKLSESQIWNSNFAFQHPYLTTNSSGEVGISVGFGGPSNHASPVVGFVGDSTLYYANLSSTTINRWGDYSAIRKHGGNANRLAVSNYFLQSQAASGVTGGRVVHQYILFGRSPGDVPGLN